jgi:hypothetical protein
MLYVFLGSVALRKCQQVRVAGVDDGHNTVKIGQQQRQKTNDPANKKRTQLGRVYRQQYQERRLCPQSGAPSSLRAWHSIPARICAGAGNYQRSTRALLYIRPRQLKGPSQPHAPVPGGSLHGIGSPLPLRISFSADL